MLHALNWFSNGKPGPLTGKDCSFGVDAVNIEVQASFNELTDKDREAHCKYAPIGVATFIVWCEQLIQPVIAVEPVIEKAAQTAMRGLVEFN